MSREDLRSEVEARHAMEQALRTAPRLKHYKVPRNRLPVVSCKAIVSGVFFGLLLWASIGLTLYVVLK